jgi:flagellar biosynthesis protein FlhG
MTMVIDQATQLRSLMREQKKARPAAEIELAPPRRASVIAITSGKGGVGKTNISVNLAITLASAGKSVVLLDADLGLANADVICNIDLPANLSHVIARRKDLSDVLVSAPGGFSLIGGASGLARMADLTDGDRQRIVNAMAELEAKADVILIDTGAGISPNVLAFTRAADHVLVVTTPEPTAITDAYAVVKVISRADKARSFGETIERRISLLVNQSRNENEARIVHDRIAKVARQFLGVSVFDAGHIPADECVSAAVRKRSPFVLSAPKCSASHAVSQLAIRLEQGVASASMQEGGFFQRLGRWFRR